MYQLLLLLPLLFLSPSGFKTDQLQFARVRNAKAHTDSLLQARCKARSLHYPLERMYIRAFKDEAQLEVWGKDEEDVSYTLLHTYAVCASSGMLGPKRKQGDGQVPEGFYFIDRFNPASNFYLSLGINYPNASDRILSPYEDRGGDIFIHGSCVTIGCLPMTDAYIEEIYWLAVQAYDAGQTQIPVHIFPKRLTESNWKSIQIHYAHKPDLLKLWQNLKKGYEHFEAKKQLPKIRVGADGYYIFG